MLLLWFVLRNVNPRLPHMLFSNRRSPFSERITLSNTLQRLLSFDSRYSAGSPSSIACATSSMEVCSLKAIISSLLAALPRPI